MVIDLVMIGYNYSDVIIDQPPQLPPSLTRENGKYINSQLPGGLDTLHFIESIVLCGCMDPGLWLKFAVILL